MRKTATLFFVFFLITVSASAQERGLTPEDFYKERIVSDTAISPTGDMIAFTVMSIIEEKNKRHREIWMQRLVGGKPDGSPFRFTSALEESSSPSWSRDGELLSFISPRGDDKNPVWFIRVSAPGGEPFHIDGVSAAPVWSPDGKWIAFIRAPEEKENGKKKEREEAG